MTVQRVLVTAVLLLAATATTATADPEHDRLTAMCGTWDIEMTFWTRPGGPRITIKGTSTIRPLLGGLFIEEQIDGALNGRAFTTLAWTGFNTSTRMYEATRISSTNTIRIAESGRDGGTAGHGGRTAGHTVGGEARDAPRAT